MNRRSFLGSILALGVAPAIVRADSLMQLVRPRRFVMGAAFKESLIITNVGTIQEFAQNVIDVTTLLSTVKEYEFGLPSATNYSYEAEYIELATSHGILSPHNLLADGKPIHARSMSFENNRITLKGLSLAEYGNRIPTFSYVEPEWKEKA